MIVLKLFVVMSAAFVWTGEGQNRLPAEEESAGVIMKKNIPVITEEVFVDMEMRYLRKDEPGFLLINVDGDVMQWTETVLKEHYGHLSDVDIYLVKPQEMSQIMDHLVRGLVFMNPWFSDEHADCIILVYMYGGIRYLYRQHLQHSIHQEIVKSFSHLMLHVPLSDDALYQIHANHNISRLVDLIFEPWTLAINNQVESYGELERTEALYTAQDEMLHYAEIRHQSVHDVSIKLVSLFYDWLDKISPSHFFFELSCPVLIEEIAETFHSIIYGLEENLQDNHLHDFIVTALGPGSSPFAKRWAEKLSKLALLKKPVDLLKAVQFEEVPVSIENNVFVPEQIRLHRGNKTVFGYIVDFFLDASRHDYLIDSIMEQLEDPSLKHLPFTTPVTELYPGDLLPITREFVLQLFEVLPQKCLDIKMLAALSGVVGLKRRSYSAGNPDILSILYKAWTVVKTRLPHANYTFKADFWLNTAKLIDVFYVQRLQSFTQAIEAITGGEFLSETLAADTLILIQDEMPATLGELVRGMVEVHVISLLEDVTCDQLGTESYQLVVTELEKLVHQLHMEASFVESHSCTFWPAVCEDKALTADLSVVISESLTTIIPRIQPELYDLISLWYFPHEALEYYRVGLADFVGASAAKFLYMQLRMSPEASVPVPPEDEVVQVNQNLVSMVKWQHQLIEHLYTNSMEKLEQVTHVIL